MVKIAALWKKQSVKDGSEYLSGPLTRETKLLVFKNKNKVEEKQPDYFVWIADNGPQPEKQ